MAAMASLANPIIRDIGPVIDRHSALDVKMNLAPGTRVISADSHWELSDDIFIENFPARLKDKAPRVWFDIIWRIGYRGKMEGLPLGEKTAIVVARTTGEGIANLQVRYRDMDAEGVEQEIVFPQTLLGFSRHVEFEVQELVYRLYNEYVAKRFAGSRSHPVGVFSNWWDAGAAERAMQQIVDLGFKTFLIPITPGKSIDGKDMSYGDPVLERFWDVIAASGLPVCFHIGEGVDLDHRGGIGATVMVLTAPYRKPFAQMVFGGVFDRHPNLQVVFAEGGLSWVPHALQDAEAFVDNYGDAGEQLKHRPSHYWKNNCHATFQNDPLGMNQLCYIGADRIMWAADYPHTEGTFGYGQAVVNAIVEKTTVDESRAILGGNAVSLFGLE
jgi:predicted TIM-barrel fold metal-dependent hydrolase